MVDVHAGAEESGPEDVEVGVAHEIHVVVQAVALQVNEVGLIVAVGVLQGVVDHTRVREGFQDVGQAVGTHRNVGVDDAVAVAVDLSDQCRVDARFEQVGDGIVIRIQIKVGGDAVAQLPDDKVIAVIIIIGKFTVVVEVLDHIGDAIVIGVGIAAVDDSVAIAVQGGRLVIDQLAPLGAGRGSRGRSGVARGRGRGARSGRGGRRRGGGR
ncbi:hypothetical protein D9V34_10145 [Mycetocola lacteus]|uniref:Uncharacterized protein n=1 Tax=Mycetocola lacteus TaxID=76637 RepID=A0A3L7AP93_9MICO|nr:hypothetical protein D9V34_10145 [Mycetocola lacteus]